MKLIHSKFNRRLTLEDVQEKGHIYHCEYVMKERKDNKWGESQYWRNAFDGFVKGWNHLAERVTINEDMEHRKMKEKLAQEDENDDGDDDDGSDDFKEGPLHQLTMAAMVIIKKIKKIKKTKTIKKINPMWRRKRTRKMMMKLEMEQ